MRRGVLALLLAAGFAFSYAVSAVPGSADNGTTTTAPTETTTTPTATTAPEPTTTAPAPEPVIPQGVSIEGVPVGGLTPSAAYASLQETFREPLRLVVGTTRLAPAREQLGAVAYIWGAVSRAKSTAPGTDVDVRVAVKGPLLHAYVAQLAKRYDRKPVDARLRLRNLEPFVSKDRPGLRIEQGPARAAIVRALTSGATGPVRIPVKEPKPQVTRAHFGPVVVIHRADNRLRLYQGMKPWRTFTVATGQSIYPTPLGRFQIVVKWQNPWWYPPASPWAAGEKPVPPGPGNPLGTRWMGLSSPGVGIHGTPDSASLGYSASHGCIRMAIPQAEWLFEHVDVGTPVYIVAA